MCLIFIANRFHSACPLILAANRDEFYARPTLPARFWEEYPHLLAGIDRQGGGTWLGITTGGKFAAITNYRDPAGLNPDAPSRGALVRDFLVQDLEAELYLQQIQTNSRKYNSFNLILGRVPRRTGPGLFYYSSREETIRPLPPGIHGLSNHLLDSPWPKVEKGRRRLAALLDTERPPEAEELLEMKGDREVPPDDQLPDTGVGLEWERCLSPMFIRTEGYGTRSTTVILVHADGRAQFTERNYTPETGGDLRTVTHTFTFRIN